MTVRLAFIILLFTPLSLFPDMGAIVPTGAASIGEPSQKALILHNGKEEILILGTDIQISPAGPLVRFIPLPSSPTVVAAKKDVFEQVNSLVKKHGLQYVIQTRGPAELQPAAEFVLNKRIGAHDITVVRLNDAKRFGEWVRNFLARKNLPVKGMDLKIQAAAADYISRGFPYFVFDIVEPSTNADSVGAIQYRFATSRLYYPLKTSNLYGGKGTVDLVIAAPTARELYGLSTHYYLVSTTAVIDPKALADACPESVAFFKNMKGQKPVLQAVRFAGELRFEDDIWTDAKKGPREIKPSTGF